MQPHVGDGGQVLFGGLNLVFERLAFPIAAGADERTAKVVGQDRVQRRGRAHQAHGVEMRMDSCRQAVAAAGADQFDRSRGIRECRDFVLIEVSEAFGRGRRLDHHRQWLCKAALSRAEPFDGRLVCGIHEQLIAAKTAERHDSPCRQSVRRCAHRIVAAQSHRAVRIDIRCLRATTWASRCLGVETTIARPLVLPLAIVAKRKGVQRRIFSLERHRANHGVARAADRTTGEGIAAAAIVQRENLSPAIVANGAVLGNSRGQRPVGGLLDNRKLAAVGWRIFVNFQA